MGCREIITPSLRIVPDYEQICAAKVFGEPVTQRSDPEQR